MLSAEILRWNKRVLERALAELTALHAAWDQYGHAGTIIVSIKRGDDGKDADTIIINGRIIRVEK